MSKKTLIYITLFAVYAFSMSYLFLLYIDSEKSKSDNLDNIIIVDEDGASTTLDIFNLTLSPGEVQEYEIDLESLHTGTYEITISLKEDDDGGLKDFVDVEIILIDRVIGTIKLKELLDNDFNIKFEMDLTTEKKEGFIFKYSMPIDIGNEAMKTYAKFTAHINISSVGE